MRASSRHPPVPGQASCTPVPGRRSARGRLLPQPAQQRRLVRPQLARRDSTHPQPVRSRRVRPGLPSLPASATRRRRHPMVYQRRRSIPIAAARTLQQSVPQPPVRRPVLAAPRPAQRPAPTGQATAQRLAGRATGQRLAAQRPAGQATYRPAHRPGTSYHRSSRCVSDRPRPRSVPRWLRRWHVPVRVTARQPGREHLRWARAGRAKVLRRSGLVAVRSLRPGPPPQPLPPRAGRATSYRPRAGVATAAAPLSPHSVAAAQPSYRARARVLPRTVNPAFRPLLPPAPTLAPGPDVSVRQCSELTVPYPRRSAQPESVVGLSCRSGCH